MRLYSGLLVYGLRAKSVDHFVVVAVFFAFLCFSILHIHKTFIQLYVSVFSPNTVAWQHKNNNNNAIAANHVWCKYHIDTLTHTFISTANKNWINGDFYALYSIWKGRKIFQLKLLLFRTLGLRKESIDFASKIDLKWLHSAWRWQEHAGRILDFH